MDIYLITYKILHLFTRLNFISVQHVVPNPETDGSQASDVRAQPAHLESYTDIMEEDPNASPDENSDADPDDGYLADDEESDDDDDVPLAQVSTCCFIYDCQGNWQCVMKEQKAH